MSIKIIIILIILFYYLLLKGDRDRIRAKNQLAYLSCFLLVIYSGFRHVLVGSDTYGYYGSFMSAARGSWADAFSGFFVTLEELRDPLYPIIEKLFSSLIPSWQLYLLALAILFYYAVYRLWKRYITSPEGVLLAMMLMLSLFSVIALSGIRQQITISISMLLIPYVEEKRWKVAIPIIIVGSLIHVSLLFLLGFIPLQSIKQKNYKILIGASIILIPIISLFAKNIVGILAGFIKNDYYMGYAIVESGGKPYAYMALCTIISIFLFINYIKLKTAPRFFLSALVLMTITFPLIIQDGSLIRVGQYFTIYIMLSLPHVLDRLKNRNVIYIAVILLLTMYVATDTSEYYFFWESVHEINFKPFGLI